MTFSKREIADIKRNGQMLIKITASEIKRFFDSGREEHAMEKLFPGKKLKYCYCDTYDIVTGDYQRGVRYIDGEETYYMFWSGIYPGMVAIGKAVDGKIYFIREFFGTDPRLVFRIIPEEYIDKEEQGFMPRSYKHTIFRTITHFEDVVKTITVEDMKCLEIAYEGVKAFRELFATIYK